MQPGADRSLVPGAGAVLGFVVAGEAGTVVGCPAARGVGTLLDRTAAGRDRRIPALEDRVAALEDERSDA